MEEEVIANGSVKMEEEEKLNKQRGKERMMNMAGSDGGASLGLEQLK